MILLPSRNCPRYVEGSVLLKPLETAGGVFLSGGEIRNGRIGTPLPNHRGRGSGSVGGKETKNKARPRQDEKNSDARIKRKKGEVSAKGKNAILFIYI